MNRERIDTVAVALLLLVTTGSLSCGRKNIEDTVTRRSYKEEVARIERARLMGNSKWVHQMLQAKINHSLVMAKKLTKKNLSRKIL